MSRVLFRKPHFVFDVISYLQTVSGENAREKVSILEPEGLRARLYGRRHRVGPAPTSRPKTSGRPSADQLSIGAQGANDMMISAGAAEVVFGGGMNKRPTLQK